MRPSCFNRPPRAAGRWHQVGRRPDGRPVLRWFPRWYDDVCVTWRGRGIGPHNEAYPLAHGFAGWCLRCRWRPDLELTQALMDVKAPA